MHTNGNDCLPKTYEIKVNIQNWLCRIVDPKPCVFARCKQISAPSSVPPESTKDQEKLNYFHYHFLHSIQQKHAQAMPKE